jgi:hypothetical protein
MKILPVQEVVFMFKPDDDVIITNKRDLLNEVIMWAPLVIE